MKLKLVVASMSVLGLISCPAFAATQAKHKHHVAKKQMVTHDYKDMGALPVETCPIVDQFTMMLDGLDQNVGRAKPTEDCTKLISLAGGINFDAKWGNRSQGYMGENNQRLSLNDAYLNVYGLVNDWTKAFASISYNNASTNNANNVYSGRYSNAYATGVAQNNAAGTTAVAAVPTGLDLEQGMIRFANFDEMPVFVQLGKQFQPFGRYRIHPITRTLAQVLSETLRTSAELGFLTRMGLHGAIYAFDNPLNERNGSAYTNRVVGHATANWGAELGFDNFNDQLGYSVGVGYMWNMIGVNDVAYAVSNYNANRGYNNRVGAVAVYGDLNSGPFTIGVRYVTALQSFDTRDLQTKTTAVVAAGLGNGAKPWAADVQAGYGFNAWTKNQNVYVGYQASGNAVNVFLPRSRWLVGYNVDMWKNTNLGAEFNHDQPYGTSDTGGTTANSSSNTFAIRAAVKFG